MKRWRSSRASSRGQRRAADLGLLHARDHRVDGLGDARVLPAELRQVRGEPRRALQDLVVQPIGALGDDHVLVEGIPDLDELLEDAGGPVGDAAGGRGRDRLLQVDERIVQGLAACSSRVQRRGSRYRRVGPSNQGSLIGCLNANRGMTVVSGCSDREEAQAMVRRLLALTLAVISLSLAVPAGGAVVVRATFNASNDPVFKPRTTQVARGTRVVWRSVEGLHTVTAYGGNWSKDVIVSAGRDDGPHVQDQWHLQVPLHVPLLALGGSVQRDVRQDRRRLRPMEPERERGTREAGGHPARWPLVRRPTGPREPARSVRRSVGRSGGPG